MKAIKLSTIIFFFALSTLTAWSQNNTKYVINDEKLEVEFNTTWTWDDIVMVKKDLKKKEILLNYTLLEFTERGKLSKISASISYTDGSAGSFTSRELKPGDGPGFSRNFIKRPIK